jgi:SAM-dependent methyltransferase
MPGEETVLRTFSSEWLNYDWDGQAYWAFRPDVVFKSMNFMLDLARNPVKNRLVLEVGIGIGGIADYMVREEGCELVGIDLSYAVDSAYRHFGRQPFLHIVQASAFAPPFRHSIFDLVYSQGVLHHTFSTRTAFEQISNLPKVGGRLYVWVYSHYDEQRTLTRRALMLMERVIRPICWRLPEALQTALLLPFIPLYLAYQRLQVRRRSGYVNFGWREAVHAARDRFTPRYVSRHTEDEVCDWFQGAGYGELQCVSRRERPDFIPLAFLSATAVDGVRFKSERLGDSSCAA